MAIPDASDTDAANTMSSLANIFGFMNIGSFYLQYSSFIDAVLAFMIFLAVSNYVFTRKYGTKGDHGAKPSRESKAIAVGVSLALAFAFAVFELNTGFNFGELKGLAAILLLAIFGILIYELMVGMFGDGHKMCAAAFAYFIMYGAFVMPYHQIYLLLITEHPLVWSILGIGFLIALIKVVMCLIAMISGGKKTDHGETHEEHEEHAAHPEHQHSHVPLTVHFTIPPANNRVFTEDKEVPLQASISGAGEHTVWLLFHNGKRIANGTGGTAAYKTYLPVGEHRFVVRAIDEDRKHEDAITIVVKKKEAAIVPGDQQSQPQNGERENTTRQEHNGIISGIAKGLDERLAERAYIFLAHPTIGHMIMKEGSDAFYSKVHKEDGELHFAISGVPPGEYHLGGMVEGFNHIHGYQTRPPNRTHTITITREHPVFDRTEVTFIDHVNDPEHTVPKEEETTPEPLSQEHIRELLRKYLFEEWAPSINLDKLKPLERNSLYLRCKSRVREEFFRRLLSQLYDKHVAESTVKDKKITFADLLGRYCGISEDEFAEQYYQKTPPGKAVLKG